MNRNDDVSPSEKIDPNDLGPEPDWLTDDVVAAETESSQAPPPQSDPQPSRTVSRATARPVETEPASARLKKPQPATVHVERKQQPQPAPATEPIDVQAVAMPSQPVAPRREHPWLWSAIPGIFLLVTVIIGWFATSQTLNDVSTWAALQRTDPPLLPAKWSLHMWWAVVAALGVFLVYGATPAGKVITRIKLTGPLLTIALIAANLWLIAQHWSWNATGLASGVVATAALLVSYLSVTLSSRITRLWQRFLAVLPLSLALAFSTMLTVVAWQTSSNQPFGDRGNAVLVLFLLVLIGAIISFFLHDGAFTMVLTMWFLGMAQRQWGDDALMSLSAIVAVIFAVALAAMGTILAVDSHKPALTTDLPTRGGRIRFWNRKSASSASRLSE